MSNWDVPGICSPSMSAFDKSPLPSYSFEELLLEAIEEVLSSLGEPTKQAVYFHLEKTYNIDKKAIPHKIDAFVKVIEEIFGFGARLIEIEIMKSLHKKFGHALKYFPKADELVYTEYLMAAKLLSMPADET